MAEHECETHSATGSGGREYPADDERKATTGTPLSLPSVSGIETKRLYKKLGSNG